MAGWTGFREAPLRAVPPCARMLARTRIGEEGIRKALLCATSPCMCMHAHTEYLLPQADLVLGLVNQFVRFDPGQAGREFVKHRFTPSCPARACLRVLDDAQRYYYRCKI